MDEPTVSDLVSKSAHHKEPSKTVPTVYLAGPIQNADDHGVSWREQIVEDYPHINWLDPLAQYNSAEEIEVIYTDEHIDTGDTVSTRSIVEYDEQCIREADVVLVNWPNIQSDGTAMEVYYASTLTTPVVVRHDEPLSIWMFDHVDYSVTTFAEAVDVIHAIHHGVAKAPNIV